jgi:hypothetical protein
MTYEESLMKYKMGADAPIPLNAMNAAAPAAAQKLVIGVPDF